MSISLLISDVDGTLVNEAKELTAATVAAVRRVKQAGLKFTIISSRPARGLQMVVDTLGIDAPFAGFNGGAIVRPDASVLVEHVLPGPVAARAVDLLTGCGAHVWVFAGRDWFLRDPEGPYVARERNTVRFAPVVVDDFSTTLGAAAKIVGVSADFDLLNRCGDVARRELAGAAEVARSQLYYLDITHPLANKGNALAELSHVFSVPAAEIAVIGDGENDIAMFERAGLRIAMGNALPHVQSAADHVSASNREDGFAAAVERFILPAAEPAAGGAVAAR